MGADEGKRRGGGRRRREEERRRRDLFQREEVEYGIEEGRRSAQKARALT